MPKYTCRICGTECYGCILYSMVACHSCGADIHREEVQESWERRLVLPTDEPSGISRNKGRAKLLQFER